MQNAQRFHRFSVAVLAATMGVILWGGYVRATGSGAGCGSHWPTCNGAIIPRPESVETVIEFTHRATSGIAFLLVVAQTIWAFRAFSRGDAVRRAAVASLVLMVTEAIVGAGLVIFEMVAGNTQTARAGWMAAHLMNTFGLLAALGLTVWRSRPPRPPPATPAGPFRAGLVLALVVALLVAASGAVAALGDTLFPARSLGEGIAQDLSPTAHLFVRLRVLHPLFAVLGGLYLLVLTGLLAGRGGPLRPLALVAGGAVFAQLAAGFVNLALLAPVAMQILHLLLADLVWLSLVILAAEVRRAPASTPAPVAAGLASRGHPSV